MSHYSQAFTNVVYLVGVRNCRFISNVRKFRLLKKCSQMSFTWEMFANVVSLVMSANVVYSRNVRKCRTLKKCSQKSFH